VDPSSYGCWALGCENVSRSSGILRRLGLPAQQEPNIESLFRFPATVRPTLFIGPPRQLGGALLEVMVEVTPPRDLHVFHVMVARPKHLDRMKEDK
jgi:hypothetical protein